MGSHCFAHGLMDARGSTGGRPMLARARDRRKSARRWTGHDRDRVDARYRIADDRGAQGRWADVKARRVSQFALGMRQGRKVVPVLSMQTGGDRISLWGSSSEAAECYSQPRSPNAERSTPGGAYHPVEPYRAPSFRARSSLPQGIRSGVPAAGYGWAGIDAPAGVSVFRFREIFVGAVDLGARDPAGRQAVLLPRLRRFVPLFESIHAAIAAELALASSGMTTPFPSAIFLAYNNCAGLTDLGSSFPSASPSTFLGACCLRNAPQIDIDVL